MLSLLQRKTHIINQLKLQSLSAALKIGVWNQHLAAWKQLSMAIGHEDIPCIWSLMAMQYCTGPSIFTILEKIDQAAQPTWLPDYQLPVCLPNLQAQRSGAANIAHNHWVFLPLMPQSIILWWLLFNHCQAFQPLLNSNQTFWFATHHTYSQILQVKLKQSREWQWQLMNWRCRSAFNGIHIQTTFLGSVESTAVVWCIHTWISIHKSSWCCAYWFKG